MKKSNLILAAIVILLVLLGFLYLIPVREGAQNAKNTKIMDTPGKTIKLKTDPK